MSLGPVSFGGLFSGLNTSAVIQAEMSIYQQPLTTLQSQQTALNTQISDFQSLNSQFLSLQQTADTLSTPTAFGQAFSVGSSNSLAVSGSISSSAMAGSLTLVVNQLATGSTQISGGSVAATNDVVASGNLLVGSGGASLGISSFGASTGLALGAHSINVTQASAGASASAGTALAASTTITSSNNTIAATINGTASTLTIATGTYTPTQLAQAITQASSGALNATVNANNVLSLSTSQQGSSASLQVTGGTSLSSLGLAAGSLVYGVDGKVSVDGTVSTITNISGSGTTQVSLASGTGGTLVANVTGGLSAGSMSAQNVSTGDGSLASVVAAINGANAGVSATALQVGTNQFALEVSANKTGASGATTIDAQAFTGSSLGALQTTTQAQNAIVSVGGVGGYQVTSNSNTLTGLLPGVSVKLGQVSASPVTLTVAPDGSQVATQVSALVNGANQILSSIAAATAYDPSTKVAGPLNGNTSLTTLSQKVLALVGGVIGSSSLGSDGTAGETAGLAVTSTGTITFNKAAFTAAYNANPLGVQALFTEGGSFAAANPSYNTSVSVAGATNTTVPGAYGVAISQSATQATDTGSVLFAGPSATLASAETYTISSGPSTATYAATAGESISNVVSGMNTALAAAGINVSASLAPNGSSYAVKLNSAAYGSAATFGVSASGTDQLGLTTSGASYTGVDVAGTINGQAATGSGQILSLSNATNPANGLVLQVTTPGISSLTTLGTVNYAPGMAQGLANLAQQVTMAPYGQLSDSMTGLQNTLANVGVQVKQQQALVNSMQATMTKEFTNMEQTLAQLSSESKFLANWSGSSGSSSSSSSSGGIFGGSSSSTTTTNLGG
ncbi:MAG: flagellar filament capping protein FliD [Acidimicrobiales bacterium]